MAFVTQDLEQLLAARGLLVASLPIFSHTLFLLSFRLAVLIGLQRKECVFTGPL